MEMSNKIVLLLILHLTLSEQQIYKLNMNQIHLLECITSILYRYCPHGSSLMISMPNELNESYSKQYLKLDTSLNTNYFDEITIFIEMIHQKMLWLLCLSSPSDKLEFEDGNKHEVYVMYIWDDDNSDSVRKLDDQLGAIFRLNHRAKFVVIVRSLFHSGLEQEIAEIMWYSYKIWDVVIIFDEFTGKNIDTWDNTSESYNLYIWLPYQSANNCENTNPFVIDTWTNIDGGKFLNGNSLFPNKIPNNLHGCPLKVLAISTMPTMVVLNNYTDENGITKQNYTGNEFHYFDFLAKAVNASLIYIPSPLGDNIAIRWETFSTLLSGKADLIFGAFPLHPLLTPFADPTLSYLSDVMRWHVPCGKPIPRMDKVTKIFAPNVWLALSFVALAAVAIMWLSANHLPMDEMRTYSSISECSLAVWAIILGVSVSDLPRSNTLRHTLFTSYLVEPGLGRQIKTLEELFSSDLTYNYRNELDEYLKMSSPEYYRSISLTRQKCENNDFCVLESFTNDNIAEVFFQLTTECLLLSLLAPEKELPLICTIEEDILRVYYAIYFYKGNPLVQTFNELHPVPNVETSTAALHEGDECGTYIKYKELKLKQTDAGFSPRIPFAQRTVVREMIDVHLKDYTLQRSSQTDSASSHKQHKTQREHKEPWYSATIASSLYRINKTNKERAQSKRDKDFFLDHWALAVNSMQKIGLQIYYHWLLVFARLIIQLVSTAPLVEVKRPCLIFLTLSKNLLSKPAVVARGMPRRIKAVIKAKGGTTKCLQYHKAMPTNWNKMAAIMNRYCENYGIEEVWEAGCASLVPEKSKLR
ncbi:hypothetical protein C0J52_15020 [Blattella germanica]|nr:hypothetical protein C0J52_15020 [Blattella germanica]